MNGASNRSKKKGATLLSSHVSKKVPAGKVTPTRGDNKPDKKPEGSTEKPYQIKGRRILDPVTKPQLTQGLSPSSSVALDDPYQPQLSITGRRKVPFADSGHRTPVTIVGYTEGLPKGLHIVGNRSPTPLSITAPKDLIKLRQQALSLTSGPDILPDKVPGGASADNNKPWTDLIEEGLNAGKGPSEVLLTLEDSPRTKLNRSLAHNSATLRKKTGGILEQPHQPQAESEQLGTNSPPEMKPRTPLTSTSPIAPWRDISAFQSPNEQRRNTFNSFRLTSPDPPKSPMAVGSRQGLSPSSQTTTTLHARNRDKQFYDVYNSSPAFSTTTGPNRDLAYLATSSVAAALNAANISGNKRKRPPPSVTGKSMTGLSLNSRINEEMLRVKKTPSQTSGMGRMVKKPGDMSRNNPAPSANLAQQVPRFPTVLKTTPVAMSAGRRFEQTRHIVTAGYNAAAARAEVRDRYSHLMSPTAQKLTPIAGKLGANPSTSPTPILTTIQPPPTPVAVGAILGGNSKQKPKPQLMPPVHVPGPKRENIYIGHYDGSDDSDSDTDLTQNVTASSNAERLKI